jgi:hypothetical protein
MQLTDEQVEAAAKVAYGCAFPNRAWDTVSTSTREYYRKSVSIIAPHVQYAPVASDADSDVLVKALEAYIQARRR